MALSRRAVLASAVGLAAASAASAQTSQRRVFVGTYTFGADPPPQGFASQDPSSKGIYSFAFDSRTGRAGPVELAVEAAYPGNLILHPAGRHLYAGSGQRAILDGQNILTAYRIEGGGLRALNAVPCGGLTPTHGTVTGDGRYLLTTNFTTANVVCFGLGANGALAERTALLGHGPEMRAPVQAPGDGALDPSGGWNRPHDVVLSRNQRFAIVAEIASNRCVVHRFDAASGALMLHATASAPAGAGPRHLAFAPDHRRLYSANEHGSSITAWEWDEDTGELTAAQTVSTLPSDFSGANTAAHIAIHPNGRFVYVSNRGHGSLAGFRIDEGRAALTPLGWTDLGSAASWCFDFDPEGLWLIAANLSDNTIVVLQADPASGVLRNTGQSLYVPCPTCVRIVT